MKIKSKAVVDTAFLHLRDAAGDLMYEGDAKSGEKVGVWLYGPGSMPFQEAKSRNANRTVDRLKAKDKSSVSVADNLSETADFLAAITDRFVNLEYDGPDGQPLGGHALAVAVYADPALGFITNQVNGWAGDWANFTPGSATS